MNKKIETPFENLLNTLDVSDYLQFDDVISGYAHAATFDDVTFIRDIPLDNESILIVGDRESIINYALTKKVKMIILIKNRKLKYLKCPFNASEGIMPLPKKFFLPTKNSRLNLPFFMQNFEIETLRFSNKKIFGG